MSGIFFLFRWGQADSWCGQRRLSRQCVPFSSSITGASWSVRCVQCQAIGRGIIKQFAKLGANLLRTFHYAPDLLPMILLITLPMFMRCTHGYWSQLVIRQPLKETKNEKVCVWIGSASFAELLHYTLDDALKKLRSGGHSWESRPEIQWLSLVCIALPQILVSLTLNPAVFTMFKKNAFRSNSL